MRVTDTNVAYEPQVTTANNELALDEVARIVSNLTRVPRLDEIKEWFSALLMRQRDYESHRVFTSR